MPNCHITITPVYMPACLTVCPLTLQLRVYMPVYHTVILLHYSLRILQALSVQTYRISIAKAPNTITKANNM